MQRFRLQSMVTILILFCISVKSQTGTQVIDDIAANTTWTKSGSPFFIEKNITVLNGVTLTIEPGVVIKLLNSALISYGKILAIGTIQDTIFFTSKADPPSVPNWDRIILHDSGSTSSEFKFCKIQYASIGLSFGAGISKIENSLIESCSNAGITNGSGIIRNCLIRNCGDNGIYVGTGNPKIDGNRIYNNIVGICTDHGNSIITNNLIYNNSRYGIDNRNANSTGSIAYIVNNTIDGNGILGTGPFGANINCDNSSPKIMNNIITNSTNAIGSGYGSGIRATSGGAPIISYNNVWNNLGGNYAVYISGSCSPGEADISQNPFFMNRAISDYSLSNLSPCIRAASPIGCPSYDIEGKLRGNPPDIGAFENIADGDQTLPVQLTSFTAEYKDNLIHIKWVTESELNNIGYEIYFKEISDTQYYFLAGYKTNESLKGHGTSSTANSYSYFHNSFKQNTIYYYKLRQVDLDGQMQEYGPVQVETTFSNNTSIPEEFYLSQNYPNPFNPSTTIEFSLQAPEQVSLKVYSISGSEVAELVHDKLPAGTHKAFWNAGDLANGVYYYVLEAGEYREVCKAILIK